MVEAKGFIGSESGVPALEARSVSCGWGSEPDIVRGVSFALEPGEIACMVGRSGCGKSTLMHALSGLAAPRAGQVLVHGHDVCATPGKVGYMLQKDLLLPSRRVVDNVALPLLLAGARKERARQEARELLDQFGLAELARKWPHELSGGQRQRVALLRTRLSGHNVVLLDEPFSALDALTRVEMRSWFCSLAQDFGWACLMITHDVDEAVSVGQRILVLKKEEGAPAQLVGCVVPERTATASVEHYELTPEFLQAKRQVLAYL